jgi:hypothetical protein
MPRIAMIREAEVKWVRFRRFMIGLSYAFMILFAVASMFFYTAGRMSYFYPSILSAIVCLVAGIIFELWK